MMLLVVSISLCVDVDTNSTFDTSLDISLQGVLITLTDANGVFVAQAFTGIDGYYSFTGVKAGTYNLTEIQPGGYSQEMNTIGTLGGTVFVTVHPSPASKAGAGCPVRCCWTAVSR